MTSDQTYSFLYYKINPSCLSTNQHFWLLSVHRINLGIWISRSGQALGEDGAGLQQLCVTRLIKISQSVSQFSHSVCPTLQPHESQHARPPCPSPTLRVYSNSCPSSRWCHPAISSSDQCLSNLSTHQDYLKHLLKQIAGPHPEWFSRSCWGFLRWLSGKDFPAKQERWVQSLGQEDPLQKEMATHSSILAWEISWTEEPGKL